MSYDVQVEEITDAQPLAVVRRQAKAHELSRVVPAACGEVWNVIRAQQVKGAGRHVAIYLDGVINLEVGVELEAPFAGHGEVVGSSLPTGLVAHTTHMGPYQKLGDAHRAIVDSCAARHYELAGPNWEIYGHWRDEWNHNPALIQTDVFYLLKPQGSP